MASCGRRCLHNTLFYLSHRLGRLYDSFYNAQISTKFVMCFAFPAAIFTIRYRADTKLGYHVFIADPSLYPDLSHKWINKKWSNGEKFYLSDSATVKDLKALVYAQQKPLELRQKEEKAAAAAAAAAGGGSAAAAAAAAEKKEDEVKLQYQDPNELLVGCRGRMFADTDNLALAVRAFCRRDPNILIWKD